MPLGVPVRTDCDTNSSAASKSCIVNERPMDLHVL